MVSTMRKTSSATLALTTAILGMAFSLLSCVNKGMTKPRSEVIEDAKAKGIEVTSISDDRAMFFAADERSHSQLLSMIRARANSADRDINYRIGPRDEIEVNVFDVPELNVTVRVRESGFIALPLVGALPAAGLTESELLASLEKRLADYVKHPQASVFISNYGSQKVAVLGAIQKPGTYSLRKGQNSILELISEAGGISDRAGNIVNFVPAELSGVSAGNEVEARAQLALASDRLLNLTPPTVLTKGTVSNAGVGIQVYLDQVLGTSGSIPLELPVRGGDMIIVPEAGKIMVEGEVERTGTFELGRQMTLLGALAAAGGITYSAKVDEIEIVRDVGVDQKARLVMDLERLANGEEKDVRLRSGDIVRVPSDSSRRLRQDTFEGIAKIINFGVGGSVSLGP
jgi:polysaccharide export outer membrane protein